MNSSARLISTAIAIRDLLTTENETNILSIFTSLRVKTHRLRFFAQRLAFLFKSVDSIKIEIEKNSYTFINPYLTLYNINNTISQKYFSIFFHHLLTLQNCLTRDFNILDIRHSLRFSMWHYDSDHNPIRQFASRYDEFADFIDHSMGNEWMAVMCQEKEQRKHATMYRCRR